MNNIALEGDLLAVQIVLKRLLGQLAYQTGEAQSVLKFEHRVAVEILDEGLGAPEVKAQAARALDFIFHFEIADNTRGQVDAPN